MPMLPFCMQFLEGFTEDSIFFSAPVPPLNNSFFPASRHKNASCSRQEALWPGLLALHLVFQHLAAWQLSKKFFWNEHKNRHLAW